MEMNQKLMGGNQQLKMQITPDMIAQSPTIACECGSVFFVEKAMFKKLSALLSPSGREEALPINTIVCDKCGKVHPICDPYNLIPEEFKSKLENNQLITE